MWPRWVRALTTVWVAIDSRKRGKFDAFWTLVILLLGPLLLPFYVASRPAIKGEKFINCYIWRFILACENLFLCIVSLASSAVFIENITTPKSKDIAEVKRAEIKAGSIVAIIALMFFIGLEKLGFDFIKEKIEEKFFS